MWYKVDVLKNIRDEEGQYFFKIKDIYKVSCLELVILGKLLGSRYLFEILHTSPAVKISKNVKSGCF